MNMTYCRLLIGIALILLCSTAWSQVPYNNWTIPLSAVNGIVTDSITSFGVRADATFDFDNLYDIPRPPRSPSGNYLEIYFPHSGGAYPPLLGTRYATDFQGPIDPTWSLSIESSTNGTVTLLWDSAYVQSIEQRVQLFLRDVTSGAFVSMRTHGSYAFSYTTKRDFQIVGVIKVNLTYRMEGFWNGSTQIVDTVRGYLANASSPYALVDSGNTLLLASGNGLLLFQNAPSGNYYLVVRHRNHLEVWSTTPVSLVNGTTSIGTYDFSASPASAYGTGALKQVGSVYVAWGGDVNQDGVVDFLDRNLTWNDRSLAGYRPTDCNGDGVVDAADDAIALNNRLLVRQHP